MKQQPENPLISSLLAEYEKQSLAGNQKRAEKIVELLDSYDVEAFPQTTFAQLSDQKKSELLEKAEVKLVVGESDFQVELISYGFCHDGNDYLAPKIQLGVPKFWEDGFTPSAPAAPSKSVASSPQIVESPVSSSEIPLEEGDDDMPTQSRLKTADLSDSFEESIVEDFAPEMESDQEIGLPPEDIEPVDSSTPKAAPVVEEEAPDLPDLDYNSADDMVSMVDGDSQKTNEETAQSLYNNLKNVLSLDLKQGLQNMVGDYSGDEIDYLYKAIFFCDQEFKVLCHLDGELKDALVDIFNYLSEMGVEFFPDLEQKTIRELNQNRVRGHVKLKRLPAPSKAGSIIEIRQRGYFYQGKCAKEAKLILSRGSEF